MGGGDWDGSVGGFAHFMVLFNIMFTDVWIFWLLGFKKEKEKKW